MPVGDEQQSETYSCPIPLRDYPNITMGHGSGGQLSAELFEHLFRPAFSNPALDARGDAAILTVESQRIAVTTDSYVVRPLFFPGGCIGDLAVHGTVNDLAVSGCRPRNLTASFILEEGLPMTDLNRIVRSMAAAAQQAGVKIVAGDTKVVDRGHGDGCFITTTGYGEFAEHSPTPDPSSIRAGDVVLLSGTIGDHGMAILSVREGLEFESVIRSDSAPLNGLVKSLSPLTGSIRLMRDPTRGGIAATLNEIAAIARVGIELDETQIPIQDATRSACDLLGLDPLGVANEGKLVAIVSATDAEALLQIMRENELGKDAAIIGTVTAEHAGIVTVATSIGGRRVLSMPIGEQLPRIC